MLASRNGHADVVFLLRNWNRTMASAALQELGVLSGVDPSLIKKDLDEYMARGKKRRNQKSKKRNRKSKKRNRKSIKK